jgi:hypothetical protein
MMQNFYNKASAHNSVQQLTKNPPKPKNHKNTHQRKKKNFETNYKIIILSKQFPFCEKERKRERRGMS